MALGKFIVLGTGIASINQLTLQAVPHVEQADLVCYMITDSSTEAYICIKNPNHFGLYGFYNDKEPRDDSYTQMAKAEAFEAIILLGVSAEDCLFADLAFDPAGLLSYEATDLFIRTRELVLSRPWSCGKSVLSDSHFDKLLDYVEPMYGANHPITNYIAAVLPRDETIMEQFAIAEIRKPAVRSKVQAISQGVDMSYRTRTSIAIHMGRNQHISSMTFQGL